MWIDSKIFKAYDVRGKYPEELDEKTVREIAEVMGKYFGSGAKVVVGRDARLSSPTLYKAVLGGIGSGVSGIKLIKAGLITTPMLYFLVNKLKADGGIMVTASHNPKEYNGLKVVGKNARPISGHDLYKLAKSFPSIRFARPATRSLVLAAPPLDKELKRSDHAEAAARVSEKRYRLAYSDFLKKFLKPKRKVKVVFDCSNGTTGLVLEKLFKSNSLINFKLINQNSDGNFPAHGPNPLLKGATKQLAKEVMRRKSDLGVIFDADGDRVFFVDNRGRWVDPNEIAYVLMQLFNPPYVAGIVSSWRLKKKRVFISRVGHYFFKKLMRDKKASLGLEHSGHYYFKNFFYCDSGILAAMEIINFVSDLDTDFASWLDALPKYYRSGEINFEVLDKEKILKKIESLYRKDAKKINKLDGLTLEFKDYWFNLRPSNTENLLRLNLEAKGKEVLKRELKKIQNML